MVYFINIKSGKEYIWTEGIASLIPIIALLLYLKFPKKELKNIFISMMIITIPLYNGCTPIGAASFYPNKIEYAKLSEESKKLDIEIRKNLKEIGFEI